MPIIAKMIPDDVLSAVHARHVKGEYLKSIANSIGIPMGTLGKHLGYWRARKNLRGPGSSPKRRSKAPAHVERIKKHDAPLESFVAAVEAKTCLWMGGGMGWEPACGCDRMNGSSYCAAHEKESRRKVDEV